MPKTGEVPPQEDVGKTMTVRDNDSVMKNFRTTIIGIDPGSSGGLARMDPFGRVEAVGMPETEREMWDWIRLSQTADVFVVIEQVGGFVPKEDGKGQPGSSMFKFGYGAGMLKGFVIACGCRIEMATPQRWQKSLGIPSKKKTESKTQWKNRLKQRAEEIFPQLKVTLKTADALLIMEYARRLNKERS